MSESVNYILCLSVVLQTTKKSPTKTIKADSYASHEVRRPQLSPSSVTGHPITKDDGKTAVGSSQTRAGVKKQKTSKRQKLNNKRVKNHTIQHVRTPSIVFGDECAFCHSFRTTEVMLAAEFFSLSISVFR